ncbi:MAG: DUF2760 domain-containing protein [Deltaproteobacteria bacterium]|nr:DUF2760 domain-containing protein [Deltaproteobacteria bacterium]
MSAPAPEIGFGTRLWYAWVVFFRVLFDAAFANRTWAAHHNLLQAPAPAPSPTEPKRPEPTPALKKAEPTPPTVDAALQLLALFQREGRFIDFLEEDVAGFADAEVGAAARVVHQGCRKALRDHAEIATVRTEEEGAKVTVPKGTRPSEVRLLGNVVGEPPFTGRLVHRGWRVRGLHLPTAVEGHDVTIVAAAEVEL